MPLLAAFMLPHPPLIVPDIGRGSEDRVKKTIESYEKISDEIAALKPETIIITSPHSVMYADYFHISPGSSAEGDFSNFGAGDVSFSEEYDEELTDTICGLCDKYEFSAGTKGERDSALDHGTMVPLYFVRQKYKGGKIVRIGLSGLSAAEHYRFGQIIKEAVEKTGRSVVFVASGDLSHKLQDYGPYGFAPEGPVFDERIMDICGRAAFDEMMEMSPELCEKAAECGHKSFVIMAGTLDGLDVKATVYSHEDVTGVGYGICSFYPLTENPGRRFLENSFERYLREKMQKIEERDIIGEADHDEYVSLAIKTVENYVLKGSKIPVPEDTSPELLNRRAGAFVSIHKNGALRGCIGTISPTTESVAKEIIDNAVSASSCDTRFSPVTADELKDLEITVDVLGEPEDIESPAELDVKRYGVIVTCGRKRGLLLPDLEGVDTVQEQVMIAMHKAGIPMGEMVHLQRFEVVRHY